ncbi:tautomerase family protein [Mangrovicoccus ximenensis]|uniref:tautomerase family protein n=1 Tax=Mangrovicoccus ximenensis TaxID=1911570 RepID=UPI000D344F14|nr:tautomerase family protein [Mangrovicoccus ximenensis]
MPHIAIKMIEGRDEALKQKIADAMVRAAVEAMGVAEGDLSVAIEDVPRADWIGQVFLPEIRGKKETLYKLPGYKDV